MIRELVESKNGKFDLIVIETTGRRLIPETYLNLDCKH
uniref:Uncharacterized protein n=1 Tax=Rhizophora mucronata TaxID=61149 RepID=A0A2P2MHG7_RHIMU